MVIMNTLSTDKRIAVVRALVEGCSIRATCRMTGVAKNTVAKLLVDLGRACAEFQDRTLRGLKPAKIQCDEIWSFCYAKQKNVPEPMKGTYGYGDVWTWVALDSDAKLVMTWHVGLRLPADAHAFMDDLAGRVVNVAQLTTDGFAAYPAAVREAFGDEVHYAKLIKLYGGAENVAGPARYSPAACIGSRKEYVIGGADPEHISTSHVERQNLTMRMSMRRFTRLTNAFSKKVENLKHAVALHFMHYNFCRVHQSLRVTPAMAAGVADHVWSMEELVGLIE